MGGIGKAELNSRCPLGFLDLSFFPAGFVAAVLSIVLCKDTHMRRDADLRRDSDPALRSRNRYVALCVSIICLDDFFYVILPDFGPLAVLYRRSGGRDGL